MGRRHSQAVIAGLATLLAALPLASVYASLTWLAYATMAIAFVVGAAMLVRTLRGPVWVQVLAMLGSLLLLLTWAFPSGDEIARVIPNAATLRHFGAVLATAGEQIRSQAVPVPDLDGLLLLTTAGIGLVALLVDVAAVGLRRPAMAGLPMLAIYSVPVAVLPDGVSIFAFGFAAVGYLWLLVSDSVDRVRRFGRRFSGEGRDVDIWEPSPLSAAGRRLGLVGLAVALLVPLAVPGMTSGLERFGTGPGGDAGTGGLPGPGASVDMTAYLKDNLTQTDEFVMATVRTADPHPYYLRLGVADQISKDGFNAVLPTGGGAVVNRPLPPNPPPNDPGVSLARFKASVEIVNLDLRLAPTYPQVTAVSGLDGNWFLDASTDQVYSRRPSVKGAKYDFDYVRLGFSPSALRTASTIPATDSGARALTNVPVYAFVSDLVTSLTLGKTTEYDKVRALYEYFSASNGFLYSLSTAEGNSGSAIVDFLQNKRGFCVQYAAALAWLVRVAGFPARVAFGFTLGSGVRNGAYSLTNLNLHAWTEVSFPGFGWAPFDATPANAVVGSTRTAWAPASGTPIDEEETTATAGPDASASAGPSVEPSGRDQRDPGEALDFGNQVSTQNPWWLVGAVAATILLITLLVPSARRRALRRRRRARTSVVIALDPAPPGQEDLVTDSKAMIDAQRDAHEAWAELLDTMIDYGVLVDPSETPRATAHRLQSTTEIAASGRPQTAVIARAEERARYAVSPVRTDQLDQAIRTARKAFAERATRAQRLSAWLFPRSVLMRWRLGMYGLYSGGVRRTGRIRDAALRADPRRRRARRR